MRRRAGNSEEAMNNTQIPTEQKPQGTRRRGMGVSDVIALIVCFIIAVAVWFYVMNTESPEYEEIFSRVAVKIDNVSELSEKSGLSVIEGWNGSVDVTVRGRRSEIVKYHSTDLSASVDAGIISVKGEYSLDVNVKLPEGLTFVSCYPSTVKVTVDEVSEKTVQVITRISEVKHSTEYELGEPVANPSVITVSGPTTVLEQVESAVVNLNLGEISGSVVVVAPVTLVDSTGAEITNPYLTVSEESVSVTVPLYELKTVPLTVAYKYGYYNSSNCQITIEPSIITLRGEHAVIAEIDSILLKTIDEKMITSDRTETVTISIPQGTSSADGVTSAKLTIRHIGTSQRTLSVTEFEILGTGYTLLTNELELVLRGPDTLVSRITDADVTVSASLSDISGAGEFRIEANVSFSAPFSGKVYELGTYYIQVRKN